MNPTYVVCKDHPRENLYEYIDNNKIKKGAYCAKLEKSYPQESNHTTLLNLILILKLKKAINYQIG